MQNKLHKAPLMLCCMSLFSFGHVNLAKQGKKAKMHENLHVPDEDKWNGAP
jgi:hypothetical protein